MQNINPFSGLKAIYPISKTLCFRLIPVGKTEEHMKTNKIFEDIDALAANYVVVKGVADRIHKKFIENTLTGLRLKYTSEGNNDSLQEYAEVYFSKPETLEGEKKGTERDEKLALIAANLKATIGNAFSSAMCDEKTSMFKALSGKQLFSEFMPKVIDANPDQEAREKERAALTYFKGYTSYMQDYTKIRLMAYDHEQKGITIPNRVIEDNLPIHLNNIKIKERVPAELLAEAMDDPDFQSILDNFYPGATIDELFSVSAYSFLMPQSAITGYNAAIGGVSISPTKRIIGLNERIKMFNDAHPKEKAPLFQKLKKQVLSDRESLSIVPEKYNSYNDIVEAMDTVFVKIEHTMPDNFTTVCTEHDPSAVYINAKYVNAYSGSVYNSSKTLATALKALLKKENPKGERQGQKAYGEQIEKMYKGMKAVSISRIAEAMSLSGDKTVEDSLNAFKRYCLNSIMKGYVDAMSSWKELNDCVHNAMPLTDKHRSLGLRGLIKLCLDQMNDVFRAVAIFNETQVQDNPTDTDFYESLVNPFSELREEFIPMYNSVRNFMTKKPYSTKKSIVKFRSPMTLEGWDRNKLPENRGILLTKGKEIYLGILVDRKLMDGFKPEKDSDWKVLDVSLIAGASKALGKVFQDSTGTGNLARYNPSPEVLSLRYKTKNDGYPTSKYTKKEVETMVSFYQKCLNINPKWKEMNIVTRPAREYNTMQEFYDDIDRQNIKMSLLPISEQFINEAEQNGSLYLFRVTCQDMSEHHHGKDGNFKVLIEEALSERNMSTGLIKICGGAAIYFRPKSILNPKVTHPAGVPIANKNPDNPNRTRTLPYDLIKDRRFTEDRYMFHIPVTIYPAADKNNSFKVNATVQEAIRNNPGMYVLGINRGERNLLSIAVTAPDGTIIEQRSLNVFDNFDYRRKLAERETERRSDRQNWEAVRDIKNIKQGYLSRAVGEVVRLMKKYNCVIAMEQLDKAFKDSRRGFEVNVYEQFERAIINRLCFCVDKDDPDRFSNALQLASPGRNEADRTKYPQNGVVFFVRPNYTSKTDPYTGFVNLLDTRYGSNTESERFISECDSFRFNPSTGRFELTFRYSKVAPERKLPYADRPWTVETYGERVTPFFQGDLEKAETVDLTARMRELLERAGIDYVSGNDIRNDMKGQSSDFWKEFLHLLQLTLRNTVWDPVKKENRIIGCTRDAKGRIYDSRTAGESMPLDGDILTAWNIARKAHIVLQRIKEFDPGKPNAKGKAPKSPSVVVKDEEWFTFVQNA